MMGGRNVARAFWLGGATVAMIFAGLAFATSSSDAPEVSVAAVERKDLSTWISSNGKVEPIDPQIAVAHVDTFVREVSVTEGASVTAGQRLMTLDDIDLRAQLARARETYVAAQEQVRATRTAEDAQQLDRVEADLRRTDADLPKLRYDRDSLQRLVDRQAATRDELMEATVALRQAEAEREFLVRRRTALEQRSGTEVQRATLMSEQARQTIRALEEQLTSTEVVAAAAGTVYSVRLKRGEHVHAGDQLLAVADLRRVQVRAFIDEPDLGGIRLGQDVVVAWDGLAGRSWTGHTTRIPAAVVSRGERSVGEVLCSVDNREMKLLPNINVDVRLRTGNQPHVLTLPRSAVHGSGASRYVFVVKDSRLHRRAVDLGIATTSEFEVRGGVAEGDLVTIRSDPDPRDGMAVRATSR
jgi:HlyD family secretion protein